MQDALLAPASTSSWAGNPVILVLAIACLLFGVWYSIHLRKTKSKEELRRERRQLSNQFLDRLVDGANRTAGFDVDADKPKKKRGESADPITMAAEKLVEEKEKKRRKK